MNTISAPALSSSYGQNIKQTFEQINSNFGQLANSELNKGNDGESVITMSVPISDLITGTTVSGYTIPSQESAFRSALGQLGGSEDDIDAMIDQMSGSDEVSYICINPTGNVTSSMPYVLIDMRFRANISVSSLVDKTDMSCVLWVSRENEWKAVQAFPTLYSDGSKLCWRINGSDTTINASGPRGEKGDSSDIYIVNVENNALETTGVSVPVEQIFVNGSWVNITDDYNLISGSCTIIFPKTVDTSGGNTLKYCISYIYKDEGGEPGKKWKVKIDNQNKVYLNFTKSVLNDILWGISPDGSDPVLPGLFIPYGTNKRWLFSVVSNSNGDIELVPTESSKTFYIRSKVAEGANTSVIGEYAHAEGKDTIASGNYSHAEGEGDGGSLGEAYGQCSHVEGHYNFAEGDYSHAEGKSTRAAGEGSHTEGNLTITGRPDTDDIGGLCAHAEGYNSHAEGNYSHAEGSGTQALGIGSHAEGKDTIAEGDYSHAAGNGSHAEGESSFACGDHTWAPAGSFACGAYNEHGEITLQNDERNPMKGYYYLNPNGTNSVIFSIGIGDATIKKNAFFVTKENVTGGVFVFYQRGADDINYYKLINNPIE